MWYVVGGGGLKVALATVRRVAALAAIDWECPTRRRTCASSGIGLGTPTGRWDVQMPLDLGATQGNSDSSEQHDEAGRGRGRARPKEAI